MYVIKQIPEDFIVEESIDVKKTASGKYTYFWLKKTNYTTLQAIKYLSKKFNLSLKFFGFAGNKDKNAVTTQLISIANGKKEMCFETNKLSLRFYSLGDRPISLGFNKGNKFTITVRNLDVIPRVKSGFINFFGEQRFSKFNVDIGRALVKGDIKKANELIKQSKGMDVQHTNKKLLKLFINAYQSFLWNKCVVEAIKNNLDLKVFPIIGFATTLEKKEKEIIEKILKDENISPRDFIIRSFPELSQEGDLRDIFCEAKDLIYEIENDELNKGKKKLILKFSLSKGCYATEFIKQLF